MGATTDTTIAIRRRALVAVPNTTRSNVKATVVGLTPGNLRSNPVTAAIVTKLPRRTMTSRFDMGRSPVISVVGSCLDLFESAHIRP